MDDKLSDEGTQTQRDPQTENNSVEKNSVRRWLDTKKVWSADSNNKK
jgi:hypothetical protein